MNRIIFKTAALASTRRRLVFKIGYSWGLRIFVVVHVIAGVLKMFLEIKASELSHFKRAIVTGSKGANW